MRFINPQDQDVGVIDANHRKVYVSPHSELGTKQEKFNGIYFVEGPHYAAQVSPFGPLAVHVAPEAVHAEPATMTGTDLDQDPETAPETAPETVTDVTAPKPKRRGLRG